MTAKLRSIKSLSTILSPMKHIAGGWVPDFESRYFTEDFPFGLTILKTFCLAYGVETPFMDIVLGWYDGLKDTELYDKGIIKGKGVLNIPELQSYGINGIDI